MVAENDAVLTFFDVHFLSTVQKLRIVTSDGIILKNENFESLILDSSKLK